MSPIVTLLLLCVWLLAAMNAYSRGNNIGALLFLAVGVALAMWRWKRRPGVQPK